GGIILLFTLVATVEGVASIIFLVIGFIYVFASNTEIGLSKIKSKTSGLAVAFGIVFFALMGMAIDQTGNVIYNLPLQIINCPAGTYLTRDAIVTNPLPGRTDINQDFNCVNSSKKIVSTLDIGNIIIVRFIEYVIIGYAFRFLSLIIGFIKE